jgi:hypothetical protein
MTDAHADARKVRRVKGSVKAWNKRPRLEAEVPPHLGQDQPRRRPSFYPSRSR